MLKTGALVAQFTALVEPMLQSLGDEIAGQVLGYLQRVRRLLQEVRSRPTDRSRKGQKIGGHEADDAATRGQGSRAGRSTKAAPERWRMMEK